MCYREQWHQWTEKMGWDVVDSEMSVKYPGERWAGGHLEIWSGVQGRGE